MNLAMRRIAAASFVGALLEWYDFYVFATASALVFGPLFFPSGDPLLSTMASFGAFASGFLARPIGGLIFGDIGDRIGRKASLIATLVIIGTGTFLIGLLPTFAQAGVWAPILLVILRVVQGIGLGGEYAGASLITIEHAPSGRRGFWGSLPQAASPGGLLLSSLVFGLIALLPPGAFIAWGWRVPFLLSVIMLGIGLYVRLHIAETPEFEAIRDAAHRAAHRRPAAHAREGRPARDRRAIGGDRVGQHDQILRPDLRDRPARPAARRGARRVARDLRRGAVGDAAVWRAGRPLRAPRGVHGRGRLRGAAGLPVLLGAGGADGGGRVDRLS